MKSGTAVKFFGTEITGLIVGSNWTNGKKTFNIRRDDTKKIVKFVQQHEVVKV